MGQRDGRRVLWAGGGALALVALAPAIAFAHPAGGAGHGFGSGFAHPFLGLDHLLAMIAVGIWAGQRGDKALWVLPAAFITAMGVGGALAFFGVGLPGVEAGILASVLVLGALIAGSARLPLLAAASFVAVFALFHGHAHGTEMPQTLSGFSYGAGVSTATALLHVAGVAFPAALHQWSGVQRQAWVRLAGVAIGIGGAALLLV